MSDQQVEKKLDELLPKLKESDMNEEEGRFLQWRLTKECGSGAEEVERILEALLPNLLKIILDVSGHAVVEKLVLRADEEQMIQIIDLVMGDIFNITNSRHGSEVLKTMLKHLSNDQQTCLVSGLEGSVVDCVLTAFGSHVIQAMVEAMPPSSLGFVVDELAAQVEKIASSQYGSHVVQAIIDKFEPDEIKELSEGIVRSVGTLANDFYGNYCVQCLLAKGSWESKQDIITVIRGDIIKYATNIHATYVVKKCVEVANCGPDVDFLADEWHGLLSAMLGDPDDEDDSAGGVLQQLATDTVSSGTVQAIIRLSRGEDHELIKERITALGSVLEDSKEGQHVMSCLRKYAGGRGNGPAP